MSINLIKIFHEMDVFARTVAMSLLGMGILSVALFIERALFYRRAHKQSLKFAQATAPYILNGSFADALKISGSFPRAPLARLVTPVLELYQNPRWASAPEKAVELSRRELGRQQENLSLLVRRGFGLLSTIGSLAPFIGLLGTVLGIIAAFAKISASGKSGLASVSGGISEALVVTALGLFVAIPAVVFFNWLSARADRLEQALGQSAGEFIDHLEFSSDLATGALFKSNAAKDSHETALS